MDGIGPIVLYDILQSQGAEHHSAGDERKEHCRGEQRTAYRMRFGSGGQTRRRERRRPCDPLRRLALPHLLKQARDGRNHGLFLDVCRKSRVHRRALRRFVAILTLPPRVRRTATALQVKGTCNQLITCIRGKSDVAQVDPRRALVIVVGLRTVAHAGRAGDDGVHGRLGMEALTIVQHRRRGELHCAIVR